MFRKVNPKGRMRPVRKPGRACDGCGTIRNPLALYRDLYRPGRYDKACMPIITGFGRGTVEFRKRVALPPQP